MSTKIRHSGIVESISEGCVRVRILQTSACAACKVASHCNASEAKEKFVDVLEPYVFTDLKVGDAVNVSASQAVAGRALLLGFGIPLVVLVTALLVTLQLTSNEGLAAMVALLSLLPYYTIVYWCRNTIGQKVLFTLEKI